MAATAIPTSKIGPFTLETPAQSHNGGRELLVQSPKPFLGDHSNQDGRHIVEVAQMVSHLFKSHFESDQYLLYAPMGKSAGSEGPFSMRFLWADPKKESNEEVAQLHESLRKTSLNDCEMTARLREAISSLPPFTENKAPGEENTVKKETSIARFKHWTLVAKAGIARDGHIVAVSNRKYDSLAHIPLAQGGELIVVARYVETLFENLYGSPDNLMFSRNGAAAGQRFKDVHVHFVPGKGQKDVDDLITGLSRSRDRSQALSDAAIQEVVARYREAASGLSTQFKEVEVITA